MNRLYKVIRAVASLMLFLMLTYSCKSDQSKPLKVEQSSKTAHKLVVDMPGNISVPNGMVWIKGKQFLQGAKNHDTNAMPREKPSRKVIVDGFFMDVTEVTNSQFQKFVNETNYITVAERPIDWEVLKMQLPAGTPKPANSELQPGSLIFNDALDHVASMDNYEQWWIWKIGANWRHPKGPESNIIGKENYPVVHIAYEDALAYCSWANRSLPTESQWECAAQGSLKNPVFTWGDNINVLNKHANTWQGTFPLINESKDGYALIAPVQSYPANSVGLYDMLGNVWEITSDVFDDRYYSTLDNSKTLINIQNKKVTKSPLNQEFVIKGGSFLCHASYCASFRISARMGMNPDSSSDHIGFRTVATIDSLK